MLPNLNRTKNLNSFPSFRQRMKIDEISRFNYVYSDIFSLGFDNLFSIIDFKSLESKENDSMTKVNNTSNTTSTVSEWPALTETTLEIKILPAPDESRFPLTSNEAVNKTQKKIHKEKYHNVNESLVLLSKVLSSHEVREQNCSKY